MNANIPFLIKLDVDLLVGFVIREGASGDTAREAANAMLVVSVANAIIIAANGDVTSALAAVDSIVLPAGTDPAKAAAIQAVIAWVGSKAASLQQLLSGSALNAVVSQSLAGAATEAIAVANKYIPSTSAAPAA